MHDVGPSIEFERSAERLRELYPGLCKLLSTCNRIRQAAAIDDPSEFFEPVALIVARGRGPRRLKGVDPIDILAWKNHVTCATRIRLAELENAVLSLLADSNVLAAMVLVRSHLEAAGMATLCLNTLSECMRSGDLELLEELIPKTLFGSALFAQAKNDEVVENFLSMVQGSTVSSRTLVDALEDFVATTGGDAMWFKRIYSVLCEYAHPNFGGTSEYRTATREADRGWIIKYNSSPRRVEESVRDCLEILERCMRVGWASCAMLDLATFELGGEDRVVYQGPSKEQAGRIWADFIAVEIESPAEGHKLTEGDLPQSGIKD